MRHREGAPLSATALKAPMGRARYSVPSMRFCAPSMPSGGTGARTTLVFRRDQDERPTDEKPIGLLRRFAATSARITLAVQDRAFARPNAGLGYLRRITNASKSRQSRDSKGPDGSNLPPSANESGCRGNLRGTARNEPLWPVLSAPAEPERDEYRRHSTLCGCVSLRGHRLVRFRNCFD
jgi:hypothetical protein